MRFAKEHPAKVHTTMHGQTSKEKAPKDGGRRKRKGEPKEQVAARQKKLRAERKAAGLVLLREWVTPEEKAKLLEELRSLRGI